MYQCQCLFTKGDHGTQWDGLSFGFNSSADPGVWSVGIKVAQTIQFPEPVIFSRCRSSFPHFIFLLLGYEVAI